MGCTGYITVVSPAHTNQVSLVTPQANKTIDHVHSYAIRRNNHLVPRASFWDWGDGIITAQLPVHIGDDEGSRVGGSIVDVRVQISAVWFYR